MHLWLINIDFEDLWMQMSIEVWRCPLIPIGFVRSLDADFH